MIVKIRSWLLSLLLPAFILTLFLLVSALFLPAQAAKGTFTVNSTADTDDVTCDAGDCTLREAITAANYMAGVDVITFSLLPDSIISLTQGVPLMIDDDLTIDGSTAVNLTVSGADIAQVFRIKNSIAVTITSLTIADGFPGADYGGGIFNQGTLTLLDSTVRDNRAEYLCNTVGCDGQLLGGGIYNGGTLYVRNSTITDNYVSGFCVVFCAFSKDLQSQGGGIANLGTLEIESSTIQGNRVILSCETCENLGAVRGGGIYNLEKGRVTIKNSTLYDNAAQINCLTCFDLTASGGGINNYGSMTMTNSTVSGNLAFIECSDGACVNVAVRGGGVSNSGPLLITNSTLNGNEIFLGCVNCTGTIDVSAGGLSNGGQLSLINSIIANSNGGDCASIVFNPNVGNLIADGSCGPAFSGDPLLGPLVDNGGPTWTHALSPISQAIDNGEPTACAASPVDNLDQRGVTRPFDGNGDGVAGCDIGAYEYVGPPPQRAYLPLVSQDQP